MEGWEKIYILADQNIAISWRNFGGGGGGQVIACCHTHPDYGPPKMSLKLAV